MDAKGSTALGTARFGLRSVRGAYDGFAGKLPARPLASGEVWRGAHSAATGPPTAGGETETIGRLAAESISCPADADGGCVVFSGEDEARTPFAVAGWLRPESCGATEAQGFVLAAAGKKDWAAVGQGAGVLVISMDGISTAVDGAQGGVAGRVGGARWSIF